MAAVDYHWDYWPIHCWCFRELFEWGAIRMGVRSAIQRLILRGTFSERGSHGYTVTLDNCPMNHQIQRWGTYGNQKGKALRCTSANLYPNPHHQLSRKFRCFLSLLSLFWLAVLRCPNVRLLHHQQMMNQDTWPWYIHIPYILTWSWCKIERTLDDG